MEELEEKMVLRDLPVDTRNYTIIDNVTGKPIDQSTYSLTIDQEVINKLNKLKRVNEEKVKQATLKHQYGDTNLVDTFTPDDNSVFTPVYSGEYIDYRDYGNDKVEEKIEEVIEEEMEEEKKVEVKENTNPAEVLQQNTILDRVVARDPNAIPTPSESASIAESEATTSEVQATEESSPVVDNSLFTPEMATLQSASEQIVNIDTKKLGPAIKPPKGEKPGCEKIKLDRVEVKEGKGVAWLAYILFFLPLLFKGKNRFVRLHANEGLELNLMEIVGAGLLLPHFLLTNLTGTTELIVKVCSILGLVILAACALTIIPMILTAMFGVQFQIPWLWKKRMIHVDTERSNQD